LAQPLLLFEDFFEFALPGPVLSLTFAPAGLGDLQPEERALLVDSLSATA